MIDCFGVSYLLQYNYIFKTERGSERIVEKKQHHFFEGNMHYSDMAMSTKVVMPTTVVPATTSMKCPRYTSFVIFLKNHLWFCSETKWAKIVGKIQTPTYTPFFFAPPFTNKYFNVYLNVDIRSALALKQFSSGKRQISRLVWKVNSLNIAFMNLHKPSWNLGNQ